ncbi:MAG: pyridine nucleotide-disulfide oxidoreductase/dicluster-binding protein, partial [Desulfomonilaceae bacterium]
AIVGAGLCGLTAAIDLSKKGYECLVIESTDRLGGSVWDYAQTELPSSEIEADLHTLLSPRITLEFEKTLGIDHSVSDLRARFEAVFLATGRLTIDSVLANCFDGEKFQINPLTFETKFDGVFSGGSVTRIDSPHSPITSVSDGRRAAISIDRFLQGVSLTASRENEGAYQTRLFTNTAGVDFRDRIQISNPAGEYSEDEAASEAGRCLQCECMECVKVCEFLSSFNGYPRKYVRQIYNNLSIVMGQRHGNKLINSCSLCGLCKEVCPEELHMGEVCKSARQTMVEQGKMPPSAHEFAIRDMEFSNSDKCSLVRHQPHTDSSAFVFFPGCRLSGSLPANVENAYRYLMEHLDGGVGLMLGCCGAPAEWSGRQNDFEKVSEDFLGKWRQLGCPTVVAACSSCYAVFQKSLPEGKLRSLWETIDTCGLGNSANKQERKRFAVHDPCSSRHEPRVHQAVRNILKKLGCEVDELALSRGFTECCGYGGLMCFANKDLAAKVVNRRIEATPEDFVTYCAVCQDHFLSQGKNTLHLLELIFEKKDSITVFKRPLSYSAIRQGRLFLKKSLLQGLWKEVVDKAEEHEMIKLYISEEIQDLMAERMILTDDVQKVIDYAEKSGRKLINKSNGHFLAHHTPAKVTYWVEYSPSEQGFTVYNAYSHRMTVVEAPVS